MQASNKANETTKLKGERKTASFPDDVYEMKQESNAKINLPQFIEQVSLESFPKADFKKEGQLK